MEFKTLFTPGKIGNLTIKNRLVMAPMGTNSHDPEGFITDQTVDFYVARAKGGGGLIMGQSSVCMREGRATGRPGTWDDKFIPGLKKIPDAVHEYDCKVGWQVLYHGKLLSAWLDRIQRPEETKIICLSAVRWVRNGFTPKEATLDEIEPIVEGYSEGVRRLKDAGFDIAELHCAHGYGITQWLSPRDNRRTDAYGGSAEKRVKIVCEILRRTREKVGSQFAISLRISGADFLPGGITVEDTMCQAPLFESAGADVLHISACEEETSQWQFLSYLFPDAAIVELAERMKQSVNIPVIAVGKIGDPFIAERVLQQGRANFVAMGRSLLADPDLPQKAREGRLKDIRRCIYCNSCTGRMQLGTSQNDTVEKTGRPLEFACTTNPALLHETEFTLKPAPAPKKMVVIGGGVAGMEAARILAQRGHAVRLYEKEKKLGGQWKIACMVPNKERFESLLDWQKWGLKRAGVRVELGKIVTREFVENEKPDAVVVATGAVPWAANIPGAGGPNVVQAVDVFSGQVHIGKRLVVVGGKLRGMEAALKLAREGKRVALTTRFALGEDGKPLDRNLVRELRNRLIDAGVQLFTHAPVQEIRPGGLFIEYNHDLVFLKADTVILALGALPQNHLAKELMGRIAELYCIGDCVSARDGLDAIYEGAKVGHKI